MGSALEFTAREREIMAVAWQCFEGEPKMNYQKLADLTGMTNTGSAYNAWNKIRNKLVGRPLKSSASSRKRKAAGPSKQTSTNGMKREKIEAQDDGDATEGVGFEARGVENSSPVKKVESE